MSPFCSSRPAPGGVGSAMLLRRMHGQSRRIRHMLAAGSALPVKLLRLPISVVLFLAGHCAVASGVLSETVLLDVHKDARLLFTEEISKGSKVERLGQGKQGSALVHYEGEIFSIPDSLLLPPAAPTQTAPAKAGSLAKTDDPANPVRYRILNSWGRQWGKTDTVGCILPRSTSSTR
jgi:hypothetical protein